MSLEKSFHPEAKPCADQKVIKKTKGKHLIVNIVDLNKVLMVCAWSMQSSDYSWYLEYMPDNAASAARLCHLWLQAIVINAHAQAC